MSEFGIAGLFAGIGGIEQGFHHALGDRVRTDLLCEWWEPAKRVLETRFPEVDLHPDIREMTDLPSSVNLVTAGFPCTDLSQAGRTAGIAGENSGLVRHVFELLTRRKRAGSLPTLLIENVPNMLVLNKGHAMRYLIDEIEALGYQWAYRVVDSRFTGVPQRRRRVLLLASVDLDPASVLLTEDAGPLMPTELHSDAYGFYWTEGHTGVGWAQDAVPTLKGGSAIGIPSPPSVWVPANVVGRKFVIPQIEDAEALQGFDRGWTDVQGLGRRANGFRWKMVGNAVTVGVSSWVAERMAHPSSDPVSGNELEIQRSWPTCAWGGSGKVWTMPGLSEFPRHTPYRHLHEEVDFGSAPALSLKATSGFAKRLAKGNLGQHPGFRDDIAEHIETLRALDASMSGREDQLTLAYAWS